MSAKIVPLPTPVEKFKKEEDRVVAENWATALREALAAARGGAASASRRRAA